MDQIFATSKITALKLSPLFVQIDEDDLGRLVNSFEWIEVRQNQELIREGDNSEYAVLVVSGVFEISKSQGGDRKLMAFAKPGAVFGEIGLLTNEPRYASCVAAQNSIVGILPRDRFEHMKISEPSLYLALLTGIALQMASRLTQVTDSVLTLKERNKIAVDAAHKILGAATQA
jgi:CRP/FNR family transcriptional regulator, cyclic AMP receptor protein